MYRHTKRITSGTLTGMVIVETLPFHREPGYTVEPCGWTGPGYIVLACEPVASLGSA